MASARIKKKRASIAAKNFSLPAETRKQRLARQRAELLPKLRVQTSTEGYHNKQYAAIKKYKEYVDKGLIKESSVLDKYEASESFLQTLSKKEFEDYMREANKKGEELKAQSLARMKITPADRWGF